jgi:hypothetical protein
VIRGISEHPEISSKKKTKTKRLIHSIQNMFLKMRRQRPISSVISVLSLCSLPSQGKRYKIRTPAAKRLLFYPEAESTLVMKASCEIAVTRFCSACDAPNSVYDPPSRIRNVLRPPRLQVRL